MNRYIGMLTTAADITQKAPESIGQGFNTLFARLGNVKAGKFVASQEEVDSENYNEDEFESLNDIEKVLDSVGIKMRENYGTWKETEDLLDEIAEKWDKWDKTTKNAVTTTLAGTRQRETILTLLENYDQVSKYERIAENSYGTAQEKMQAYTGSIEASQKRLQAAMESFALALERSEIIEKFYNTLAFAVNNIQSFAIAIAGFLAITKGKELFSAGANVVTGAGIQLSNLGFRMSEFMTQANQVDNSGNRTGVLKTAVSGLTSGIKENYLTQVQARYMESLSRNAISLDDLTKQNYINLQNAILASDKQVAHIGLQALLFNGEEQEAEQLARELYTNEQAIAIKEALVNISKIDLDKKAAEIFKENQLETMDEAYIQALKELIMARKKLTQATSASEKAEYQAAQSVGANYADAQKRPGALSTFVAGGASIFGSIMGGSIGGEFTKNKFGEGATVIGAMLGSQILSKAGSTLVSGAPKLLSTFTGALTSGGGITAAVSTLFNPVGAAVLASVAAIAVAVKLFINNQAEKERQKLLEEQANAFQEASTKYQDLLSVSIDASKFDELSKGVDKFGKNVSLTEDEYKEFLEINNKIAEQAPSLVSYIDEQGNKFVSASEGCNTLTESIENLIKIQQREADQALTKPETFNEAWNTAKDSWSENKEKYDKLKRDSDLLSNYSIGDGYWERGYFDEDSWDVKNNRRKRDNKKLIKFKGENNTEALNKAIELLDNNAINYKTDYIAEDDSWNIFLDEQDLTKAEDALKDFVSTSKEEMKQYQQSMNESKDSLNDFISAMIRELSAGNKEYWSDFDTEGFNQLTDEEKGIIRTKLTDLIDFSDIDPESTDGREYIAKVINNMQQALNQDENGLIMNFGFEYNGEQSYKEFVKGREDLLSNIINWLRSAGFEENQIKDFMAGIGFTYVGTKDLENGDKLDISDFSDDKNYIKKINEIGKLDFNIEDAGFDYTIDELKEIYEWLNSIKDTYPGLISEEEVFNKIVTSKYAKKSTKELANEYKKLGENIETLSASEQTRTKLITDQLDNWKQKLGDASEGYDKILAKIERMPSIDNLGIVDESPEEIQNRYAKYEKIKEYLDNEFKGEWDLDILNDVVSDASLAPFVNDIEVLKAELNTIPTEFNEVYKRAIANAMGQSEGGYKALLGMHSDLVEKMNSNYKVDLTQYKSLEQAKNAVNAQALIYMQDEWKDYVSNLSVIYQQDLKLFHTAQEKKLGMLGLIMTQLGLASNMEEGMSKASHMIAADALDRRGQGDKNSYKNAEAHLNNWLMNTWAKKNIDSAKAQMDALMADITIADIDTGKWGDKSSSGSGSGSSFTDDLMRDLDTLKKLDELIDKEYENWLKWNDAIKTTTDSLNQATSSALDTAVAMGDFLKSDYYDKKGSSLDALIAATEAEKAEWEALQKNGKYYNFKGEQITTKEFLETSMDYEKQLIELKKQRFNLDDEYYDDWLNTLKLQKDLIDGDEKRLGIYEDYNDYLAVDENYNKTKLANLQQQLKVAQEALYVAKVSDNQDEYLENLKRVRDLEDEITDLIYQQKKDRVDLLESIGVSYATLIEAQKQLLAYTYTQEDQIENQNKLIDLLKQERDLRLEINESNRKILEQAAKYYEGNAYTRPGKYDDTVNKRDELLKADAELLWSEYQKAIARAQNILRQERDENGNQRYTETEINIKAAEDEDARNLLDKYLQTIEERGNLIVERFEKRIAQIDNAISDLETTKGQEWGSMEDINPYWDKYVALLQSKVAEIEEVLQNSSILTDEQINYWVDQYNSAVSALNQANRDRLSELTQYSENQFSALEDWIGEYIDNLGKLKDLVSDYYDNLLPDLEKEIDDRQDNVKLLELEAQLLNAREKQRVNL